MHVSWAEGVGINLLWHLLKDLVNDFNHPRIALGDGQVQSRVPGAGGNPTSELDGTQPSNLGLSHVPAGKTRNVKREKPWNRAVAVE